VADATDPNLTPIEAEWLNFTRSLRLLLVPRASDRPLDQCLQFRNDVLALVERSDFILGLRSAWPTAPDTRHALLLVELRALSLAMELAQHQEKATADEKAWIRKWLGRASTATSSTGDILGNASPLVKGSLKVLGNLLDVNAARPDEELKRLDRLAQGTIAYLVVVGLGSFFGAYVLAARRLAGLAPTTSGSSTIEVTLRWLTIWPVSLFGFSGSAVAALTSCLDRYAVGFEREDGKVFPEDAKKGEGKFNRRFARWLFVRPFLGAVIGPIFVWGLSHFVRTPTEAKEWTQTLEALGFTAFIGGLLAKSVVDLIKRLFKNVFSV
jgi:hypothetical protein